VAEPRLDGVRALILGGRTPIGGAAVVALKAAGAVVVVAADDAAPEVAITDATRQPGGLGIVVHVSAPSTTVAFLDRTDAAWSADLEERIAVPIRVARAAAVAMRPTGGGSLVFVGTLDAIHAYHGHAGASVAMGALGGLVRSLAVELAPIGVRANVVLVGPLHDAAADADPAFVERTLLRSPSKRFVTAQEAAAAIVFVAGPGADFMTGASLRVDAGWSSLNQAPDGMRFP